MPPPARPLPPELRTGPPRVLLVMAHPRPDSFCAALADAYAQGAAAAGAELRRLDLQALAFEPDVLVPAPQDQTLEPDLAEATRLVAWAEHLVFVFPTWWGTMPARLKGFLDRVLVPGFAFADRDDGEGWERLLTGRTAHLLTTMDTPPWVHRWIYRAPGLNALDRATLGFCGVAPVRRTVFGPVKDSTAVQRTSWLEEVHRSGLALRDGALTAAERRRRRLAAWLASFRLQFHPMAWAAYALGALGAVASGVPFDAPVFVLGFACLFFLELATVFTNDRFDFDSDVLNRHHGPFTGGSRVLVDGSISLDRLQAATMVALGLFAASTLALAVLVPPLPALPLLGILAVLALGYTVPPLQLCWRGLGELDVGVTHSLGVVLCGWVFQGGILTDPWPWLVALPLFLAILPAIVLSGIPDHDADRAVGKGTLAVRFGPAAAVVIAEAATLAAALAAILVLPALLGQGILVATLLLVVPYAMFQLVRLERYRRRALAPRRIDGLMAVALTYILWFVALPLAWVV